MSEDTDGKLEHKHLEGNQSEMSKQETSAEAESELLRNLVEVMVENENIANREADLLAMKDSVNAQLGHDLIENAKNGKAEKIESLLKDPRVDPNFCRTDGQTALHVAATNGWTDAVAVLLEFGANVNSKDKSGRTALHYAGEFGNTESIRVLLERGADVNSKDKALETAMHLAALKGCADAIVVLVESGANVNQKNLLGQTALSQAAVQGNAECIRILLEKGTDVNSKNISGYTAEQLLNINYHGDLAYMFQHKGIQ